MFYAPEIMNHLDMSSITYFSHCFVLKMLKQTTVSNNINKLKEQQKHKYTKKMN